MTKCIADVVVYDQGKILLLKPSYAANWNLPGGHVEEHETPFEAASREAIEEAGPSIKVTRLLCVNYERGNAAHKDAACFLFLGTVTRSDDIHVDGGEIVDYKWASYDEALNLLHPLVAAALPQVFDAMNKNQTYYCEDGQKIG